jgi:hypothetical protein
MTTFAELTWRGTEPKQSGHTGTDAPLYARLTISGPGVAPGQRRPEEQDKVAWNWITIFKYDGGARYGMLVMQHGKTVYNATELEPIEAQCMLIHYEELLEKEKKNGGC